MICRSAISTCHAPRWDVAVTITGDCRLRASWNNAVVFPPAPMNAMHEYSVCAQCLMDRWIHFFDYTSCVVLPAFPHCGDCSAKLSETMLQPPSSAAFYRDLSVEKLPTLLRYTPLWCSRREVGKAIIHINCSCVFHLGSLCRKIMADIFLI